MFALIVLLKITLILLKLAIIYCCSIYCGYGHDKEDED